VSPGGDPWFKALIQVQMLADAVVCEPVSLKKFPGNREKNWENPRNPQFAASKALKEP
jgi:hypothetical protein